MASGLGILIVFLILILLSVLMLLIRKIFDESAPKPEKKSATPPTAAAVTAAAVQPVESQLPLPVLVAAAAAGMSGTSGDAGFITAAVAAYFASEDENSSGVKAKCWTSSPGAYDPWVANNKLSKTVPGV